MFIAALFTLTKTWKQTKCPPTDEWIKKMWYIYTMGYYSAIKKKEILPFTTTWMDFEGITLSEISQTEKDKYCVTSLMCRILKTKQKQNPQKTKTKLIDTKNRLVVARGGRQVKCGKGVKMYKFLVIK